MYLWIRLPFYILSIVCAYIANSTRKENIYFLTAIRFKLPSPFRSYTR